MRIYSSHTEIDGIDYIFRSLFLNDYLRSSADEFQFNRLLIECGVEEPLESLHVSTKTSLSLTIPYRLRGLRCLSLVSTGPDGEVFNQITNLHTLAGESLHSLTLLQFESPGCVLRDFTQLTHLNISLSAVASNIASTLASLAHLKAIELDGHNNKIINWDRVVMEIATNRPELEHLSLTAVDLPLICKECKGCANPLLHLNHLISLQLSSTTTTLYCYELETLSWHRLTDLAKRGKLEYLVVSSKSEVLNPVVMPIELCCLIIGRSKVCDRRA